MGSGWGNERSAARGGAAQAEHGTGVRREGRAGAAVDFTLYYIQSSF